MAVRGGGDVAVGCGGKVKEKELGKKGKTNDSLGLRSGCVIGNLKFIDLLNYFYRFFTN